MDSMPPLSLSPLSSSSSSSNYAGEISPPPKDTLLTTTASPGCGPRGLAVLSGHAGSVSSLALCGEFVLSASDSTDIVVWQQPDLRRYARFGAGAGSVKAVAASGSRVFTAHQDRRVRVWEVSRRKENAFRLVATLPTAGDYLGRCLRQRNYVQTRRHHRKLWIEHADCISCLAVSGGVLYSGSWDKTIKVWSFSDLRCLESIKAHDDAVNDLAVEAAGVSGAIIYSASADGTIKAWERQSDEKGSTLSRSSSCHRLKRVLVVEGQRKGLAWNAVVLAGEFLYGGSSDGRVVGWQVTGEREWSITCDVRAHSKAVLCMCVVGKNVVCSGSADRSICVWSKGDNGELTPAVTVNGHDGPVNCLQGARHRQGLGGAGMGGGSGFLLYSGGLDKTLRVWWVPVNCGYGDSPPPRSSFSSSDSASSSVQGDSAEAVTVG